ADRRVKNVQSERIMKYGLVLGLILLLGGAVKLDEATFSIGNKYYQQGLYTEAEKRFLEIVRRFPDSPKFRDSLFMLGKTYAQQGNDKAALQYYKLLLNKAQTITEKQGALLGIAKSWLQLGVNDKAAEFYSFYAVEYPESAYAPAALYFAGLARERENKIPEAVEKYRLVFERYPASDYQARAIEKVAVLDQNTPETLWNTPVRTARRPQGVFPDDEPAGPGYNAPAPRAQEFGGYPQMDFDAQGNPQPFNPIQNYPQQSSTYPQQQVVPQQVNPYFPQQNYPAQQQEPAQQVPSFVPQAMPIVLTQTVQSPPIILTQTVQSPPLVVTQTIQSPPVIITQTVVAPQIDAQTSAAPMVRPLPANIQQMMTNSVVVMSNGEIVSANSPENAEEAAKIAAYRRQWEADRLQIEREQNLKKATQSVDQMLTVTDDKEKLLQAKQASLLEKQNSLRSEVYSGLNNIDLLKPIPYRVPTETAPVASTNSTNATTNTPPPVQTPPQDYTYPGDANDAGAYDYGTEYGAYGLDGNIDESATAGYTPLLDQ
ncbi:MAG: tetratricopeptide repeat protein, partial [Brevinema sp.]